MRKGEVRDVNGTARVVTIQPNIGEKREVRDVNGTPRVVTFPPNIGEKRGGQERQRGARDVYGRDRDVSFPPIIAEKKSKYGTFIEQSKVRKDVNGRITGVCSIQGEV